MSDTNLITVLERRLSEATEPRLREQLRATITALRDKPRRKRRRATRKPTQLAISRADGIMQRYGE